MKKKYLIRFPYDMILFSSSVSESTYGFPLVIQFFLRVFMKISVKSFLASALLISMGLTAQVASATTHDITSALQAKGYVVIRGDFDAAAPDSPATTFSDLYQFVIGPSQLDAGFYANQGTVVGLDISKFDLLNADTGAVVAVGSGTNGSFSIGRTLLTQGSYVLEIAGSVNGSAVGNYAGTLNISAVPEPETYGMMLGGLALMGVVARRKAKKSA